MESIQCERLQRISVVLSGNNVLVPVAAAVAELEDGTVTTPGVVRQLGGQLPSNRVSKALAQLDRLGALNELPYPGRPHPRVYEMVDGPFWQFVRDWALDPAVDVVAAQA